MPQLLRPTWLLALGFVLAPSPARAAEVEKWLPADTQVVLSLNVGRLLDAPVVKKHALEQARRALARNPEAQEGFDALGLDPFKDVTQLYVTLPGDLAAVQGKSTQRVLLIARGDFDLKRIEAAADAHARKNPDELKVHRAGGTRLYELKPKNQSDAGFAAFADKNTLVLSPSKAYLQEGLQAARGERAGKLDPQLVAHLDKADQDKAFWLAAVVPAEAKKLLADNPQTARFADKLLAVTGELAVTDGLAVSLRVHTKDARSAEEIRRLLDGVKALAMLAVAENEQYGELLGDFFSGLKLTADKEGVLISGKVSGEQIESAVKKGDLK